MILVWFLFCFLPVADQADLSNSTRLVLTFQSSDQGLLALDFLESGYYHTVFTVVKQYGRRLVLDVGRPVDVEQDTEIVEEWLDSAGLTLVSLEVDLFVGHSQMVEAEIGNVTSQSYLALNASGVEWHFLDSEPYSLQMEQVWNSLASSPPALNESRIPLAVLDSGLASLVQGPGYFESLIPGYDFVSDPSLSLDGDGRDPDPTDPGDAGPGCPVSSWHGTKMAAAMCLLHNVVPGVHSMLPNRVIALQPVRVLGECSTGYANDVADAIVWASGGQINGIGVNPHPALVVSMSFSGIGDCPSFLQSAVDLAASMGVVLVATAGNQGGDVSDYFPANCIGVVVIGASTRQGTLAGYSNFGVDLVASAAGGDSENPLMTVTIDSAVLVPVLSMGTSFSTAFTSSLVALKEFIAVNQGNISIVNLILSWNKTLNSIATINSVRPLGIGSVYGGCGIESGGEFWHELKSFLYYILGTKTLGNSSLNGSIVQNSSSHVNVFPVVSASCAAGTYGSASCTSCPINTYSAAGATACSICPSNSWSAIGSSVCTLTPIAASYPLFALAVDQQNFANGIVRKIQGDAMTVSSLASIPYPQSYALGISGTADFALVSVTNILFLVRFYPTVSVIQILSIITLIIADVKVSSDNKYAYIADNNGLIVTCSLTSYATSTIAGGASGSVDGVGTSIGFQTPYGANGLALSPDRTFVLVSEFNANKIRKLDLTVSPVKSSTLISSGLNGPGALALSPDGTLLIILNANPNTISLYNMSSGKSSQTGAGPSGSVFQFCDFFQLSNNYVLLSSSADNKIYSLNVSSLIFSVMAGSGNSVSTDGTGIAASFSVPSGFMTSPCLGVGYGVINLTSCGQCLAGSSSNNYSKCVLCVPGTYSTGLGIITSATCTKCVAGKYASASGLSNCTLCQAGSYSSAIGASNCASCLAGAYSTVSGALVSSICSLCQAGAYSSASISSSCTLCPAGAYSSASGASNCVSCQAGAYSTVPGALFSSSCTLCQAGAYSSASISSNCTLCPAGAYSSASGASNCVSCQAGAYSTVSGALFSSSCTLCQAGAYSSASISSSCTLCQTGAYSTASGAIIIDNCTLCQAGAYSTVSGAAISAACSLCPVSTYSTTSGARSSSICSLCMAGTYSSVSGVSNCTLCQAGAYSNVTGPTASSTCSLCRSGKYSTASGAPVSTACISCMVGTYSSASGASYCTLCQTGAYSNATGATVSSTCSLCISGKYSTVPGAYASTACVSCMAGTYSSASGASNCTLCQAGAYSTATGATIYSTCSLCLSGKYSTVPGASASSVCVSCMAGTYSSASGASNCTLCQTGAYSTATGATISSTCSLCIPGKYNTAPSAPASTSCALCMAGTYSSASGASYCASCQAGAYSTATGATISSTCSLCIPGKYNTALGSSASSACTMCLAGTYSSATGASVNSTCALCQSGAYSTASGATISSSCSLCPAGDYNTGFGMANSAICLGCSAGTFSTGLGMPTTATCLSCNAGTYSTGYAAACSNCVAGKYSSGFGMSDISLCLSCNLGVYSSGVGMTICTSCILGFYGTSSGATSSASCITCASGTYSTTLGVGSCIICLQGTYSSGSGMTSSNACLQCVAGTYTNSFGSTVCAYCVNGKYDTGIGMTNSATCLSCAVGSFSSGTGISVCTLCVAGSYSSASGISNDSACTLCQAGTYSSGLGYSTCQQCIGCSSCPTGSTSDPTVCDCPAGYYGPSTTGCTKCPPNTNSSQGSTTALGCRCFAGYVCTYTKVIRISLLMDFVNTPAPTTATALLNSALMASVAQAAGVPVSNIQVVGITQVPQGRRRALKQMTTYEVVCLVSGVGPHSRRLRSAGFRVWEGEEFTVSVSRNRLTGN